MTGPRYMTGEEMQVGDRWKCLEWEDNDYYTIVDIVFIPLSNDYRISWRHVNGVQSFSWLGENDRQWYLISRSGPKVRKKTGFGKFIQSIEDRRHEPTSLA